MPLLFARRLGQSLLVLLAVSFISFLVFRHIGDPTISLLGEDASLADRQAVIAELGFDQPVAVQYLRYMGNVLQGEFGVSYRLKRPVVQVIAERLPATLELALIAALLAVTGGVILGVYTAIRRDTWLSRALMTLSLVGVSLPTFLIGIGLIYLFAVELQWLPSFGRGDTVQLGGWTTGFLTASGWASLVLPVCTLAMFKLTLIMRLVRAEMLEALRADYVRFARARGLPEKRIHYGHALRNTLIPVVTITGLQIGSLIAFAIVTETVFQWPGVGLLFINSIQGVDVPVIAAYLMLIAALYVGNAHHQRVEPAARVARDQAQRHADGQRQRDRGGTDEQRHAQAVENRRVDIAALLVCAQRIGRAREPGLARCGERVEQFQRGGIERSLQRQPGREQRRAAQQQQHGHGSLHRERAPERAQHGGFAAAQLPPAQARRNKGRGGLSHGLERISQPRRSRGSTSR